MKKIYTVTRSSLYVQKMFPMKNIKIAEHPTAIKNNLNLKCHLIAVIE